MILHNYTYIIVYVFSSYGKAIHQLENVRLQNAEEETEMNKLLSQAYINLAVCYNKLGKPKMACTACNKVPNRTAKSYYQYV